MRRTDNDQSSIGAGGLKPGPPVRSTAVRFNWRFLGAVWLLWGRGYGLGDAWRTLAARSRGAA